MSAVAGEKVAARFNGFEEVESANGAAGPECFFTFTRDHDCGTVIAFEHSGCGDAEGRIGAETLFDCGQDFAFFLLTVGVETIEFGGEFAGADSILHAEQFDHVAGHVHASGGVDTRRDSEGHLGRRWWPLGGNLRDFQQSFQAGVHGLAQGVQSKAGKNSILTSEGNCIGNCGYRYHLHERQQQPRQILDVETALH